MLQCKFWSSAVDDRISFPIEVIVALLFVQLLVREHEVPIAGFSWTKMILIILSWTLAIASLSKCEIHWAW